MPELATHALLIGAPTPRTAGAAARQPSAGADASESDFGAAFAEAELASSAERDTAPPGSGAKKAAARAEATSPRRAGASEADEEAAASAATILPPSFAAEAYRAMPASAAAAEFDSGDGSGAAVRATRSAGLPASAQTDSSVAQPNTSVAADDRRAGIAAPLSDASADAAGSALPAAAGAGGDEHGRGGGAQGTPHLGFEGDTAPAESASSAQGKTAVTPAGGASTSLEASSSTPAGRGEAAATAASSQQRRAAAASAATGAGAPRIAMSAAKPTAPARGSTAMQAVSEDKAALSPAASAPTSPPAERLIEPFPSRIERALAPGLLSRGRGDSVLPAAAAPPALAAFGLPPSSAAALPQFAVATPVGSAGFAEEFTQRVAMLTRGGVHRAELSLTPADLGPVEISIEVRGAEATLLFTAPHAATRAALDEALPRLREMLNAQGLQLADARVGTQAGGGSSRDGERRPPSFVGAADRVQARPEPAAPAAVASARPRPTRLIDDIA